MKVLCKERGYKKYSALKKPQLIDLLGTPLPVKVEKNNPSKPINSLIDAMNKKSKRNSKKSKSQPAVIAKIKKSGFAIKRNSFGNFEHEPTHFVLDNATKTVTGKQNPDGSIDTLSAEDINVCNQYKFTYILPDNLGADETVEKEEVEELDEEVDVEYEEVDVEYEEYEEYEEEIVA